MSCRLSDSQGEKQVEQHKDTAGRPKGNQTCSGKLHTQGDKNIKHNLVSYWKCPRLEEVKVPAFSLKAKNNKYI